MSMNHAFIASPLYYAGIQSLVSCSLSVNKSVKWNDIVLLNSMLYKHTPKLVNLSVCVTRGEGIQFVWGFFCQRAGNCNLRIEGRVSQRQKVLLS